MASSKSLISPDVFPEELPEIFPEREIEFFIDLALDFEAIMLSLDQVPVVREF